MPRGLLPRFRQEILATEIHIRISLVNPFNALGIGEISSVAGISRDRADRASVSDSTELVQTTYRASGK